VLPPWRCGQSCQHTQHTTATHTTANMCTVLRSARSSCHRVALIVEEATQARETMHFRAVAVEKHQLLRVRGGDTQLCVCNLCCVCAVFGGAVSDAYPNVTELDSTAQGGHAAGGKPTSQHQRPDTTSWSPTVATIQQLVVGCFVEVRCWDNGFLGR